MHSPLAIESQFCMLPFYDEGYLTKAIGVQSPLEFVLQWRLRQVSIEFRFAFEDQGYGSTM